MAFHVPDLFRVRTGPMASDASVGNNGYFLIRHNGCMLRIIVSDGELWDHVSVSIMTRCPSWDEMAFVKNTFWDKSDCVVQYHPPEIAYVNFHPYCLHLWRPQGVDIPQPPAWMVGPMKETPCKT